MFRSPSGNLCSTSTGPTHGCVSPASYTPPDSSDLSPWDPLDSSWGGISVWPRAIRPLFTSWPPPRATFCCFTKAREAWDYESPRGLKRGATGGLSSDREPHEGIEREELLLAASPLQQVVEHAIHREGMDRQHLARKTREIALGEPALGIELGHERGEIQVADVLIEREQRLRRVHAGAERRPGQGPPPGLPPHRAPRSRSAPRAGSRPPSRRTSLCRDDGGHAIAPFPPNHDPWAHGSREPRGGGQTMKMLPVPVAAPVRKKARRQSGQRLGVTDSNGNIDRWQIQLSTMSEFLFPGIITASGGAIFGYSDVGASSGGNPFQDNGGNFDNPGVWTILPEPPATVLLAVGLCTLSAARQKRAA